MRDEDLAYRLKQGDSDALRALVERHHSPLLGYLYRLTGGDRTLAEDLVQDTFLRALRALASYEYPRPFKPWLYAIATNLGRDHFKRAETRQTVIASSLSDEALHYAHPHPYTEASEAQIALEERVQAQDEAQQVIAALTVLPAPQRETVILRYYQELSLAEIAETLGIPVGTVKSRLSLGLRRLREVLESIEGNEP